jgi:hypothetical protein
MRRVFQALDAGGWIDGNKRLGNASPGLYEVVYTLQKIEQGRAVLAGRRRLRRTNERS